MKRIVISLVFLSVAISSAFAQIGVGAGYVNLNTKTQVADASQNKQSSGFYAGADYTYSLGNGFAVMPGIYYAMTSNTENLLGLADVKTTNHTIAIPVNFAFGLEVTDGLVIFPFAGPQINFGLASKTKADVVGDTAVAFDNYKDGELNRFNLSLGAGVGIDVAEMIRIKFAYNWGLLNLSSDDDVTITNTNWQIGAAFLF